MIKMSQKQREVIATLLTLEHRYWKPQSMNMLHFFIHTCSKEAIFYRLRIMLKKWYVTKEWEWLNARYRPTELWIQLSKELFLEANKLNKTKHTVLEKTKHTF